MPALDIEQRVRTRPDPAVAARMLEAGYGWDGVCERWPDWGRRSICDLITQWRRGRARADRGVLRKAGNARRNGAGKA